MAEIRLETVSKTFGSLAAVKDVTLKIDDGTFFVMLVVRVSQNEG
jgi:ABC-type sugar transport system ATPase subunit